MLHVITNNKTVLTALFLMILHLVTLLTALFLRCLLTSVSDCCRWLSETEGDGKCEVELTPGWFTENPTQKSSECVPQP